MSQSFLRFDLFFWHSERMLYPLCFLSTLTVIKAIQRTYKIAGNSPDPMERNRIELIVQIDEFTINIDIDTLESLTVFYAAALNIGCNLFQRQIAVSHIHIALINHCSQWRHPISSIVGDIIPQHQRNGMASLCHSKTTPTLLPSGERSNLYG